MAFADFWGLLLLMPVSAFFFCMDILESMKKEMLRRRLSRRTMKTYLFYVRKFLLFCDKEPRRFSKKDCKNFLLRFMDRDLNWTKVLKGGDKELIFPTEKYINPMPRSIIDASREYS